MDDMIDKLANRPVFKKYGGVYQFFLEKAEDLDFLIDLEEGRWMATSCPLFGLRIDPAFLKLLDADGNGRIISDEVCLAARWLRERLKPDASWTETQPRLALELIDPEHAEGPGLLEAARHALAELAVDEAREITLDQVRAYRQKAAQLPRNGDGIVPPETMEDPALAQFGRELIAALGGVTDASGKPGIDTGMLERFEKEASAFLQWREKGLVPEGEEATEVMPFGERTPAMFAALNRVRDKVEEFFSQCSLVRFDPAMVERMGLREEERSQLDYTDRQAIGERLQRAPLAGPRAEGILPLKGNAVNEVFCDQLEALRAQVAVPIFGEATEALTESQWQELLGHFAAHEAWSKARPATGFEALGSEKLRAYLDAPHAQNVRELIAADKAVAGKMQKLQDLEKLILLHQWLFAFANNFVSFPNLFTAQRAMFEMGTLVLEGREFNFSVQVENRTVHANLAKNSGMFLLYLQISGFRPEDNFEVVVPVTRGETDGLYAGRRGVFFTIEGRELDAQIVQIVDNPVSFSNLMKAPIRFLRGLVARRFEQMSGSLQKEVESSVGKAGTQVESSLQTGMREAPQAAGQVQVAADASAAPRPAQGSPAMQDGGRTAGNVRDLMIGVGFLAAGLGTALKFLSETARQFANPQVVKMVFIILGVFVAVMALFTAISAWGKLRRRDLGGLLQASGWAINGRMRLTRVMARIFTRHTPLPPLARRRRWYAARSEPRPPRQPGELMPLKN